jgi:hypothetical protein
MRQRITNRLALGDPGITRPVEHKIQSDQQGLMNTWEDTGITRPVEHKIQRDHKGLIGTGGHGITRPVEQKIQRDQQGLIGMHWGTRESRRSQDLLSNDKAW